MSVDAENSAPSRRSPTQQAISSAEQIQFAGELAFVKVVSGTTGCPGFSSNSSILPSMTTNISPLRDPLSKSVTVASNRCTLSIRFKAFNHLLRKHLRRRRGRIDPNNSGGVTLSSLTRYFSILSHLRVLSQLPRPYIQLFLVHKVLTDIDRLLQGAPGSPQLHPLRLIQPENSKQ